MVVLQLLERSFNSRKFGCAILSSLNASETLNARSSAINPRNRRQSTFATRSFQVGTFTFKMAVHQNYDIALWSMAGSQIPVSWSFTPKFHRFTE